MTNASWAPLRGLVTCSDRGDQGTLGEQRPVALHGCLDYRNRSFLLQVTSPRSFVQLAVVTDITRFATDQIFNRTHRCLHPHCPMLSAPHRPGRNISANGHRIQQVSIWSMRWSMYLVKASLTSCAPHMLKSAGRGYAVHSVL